MRTFKVICTYALLIISICTILYIVIDKFKPTVPVENDNSKALITENIVLKDLINSNETIIDFSEKPTVILFFTSWCPYCNDDAPKIVNLHNKYKDNLNVYGINLIYRDDIEEVKEYVEKYNINYPTLLDDTGKIYDKYGGSGFPSLYFFNSKGEVIDQIIGSTGIETIESSFINFQERFNS